MRILRQASILAITALAISSCRDEPPTPPRLSEAIPNIPLPPQAVYVSRSGGADALQLTFRSALSPDTVAGYYRQVLSRGEWSLVSDTRTREGTIALYAERAGKPPLWVSIMRDGASTGTLLNIAGAVPRDSTADSLAPDRDS
jgi:hypothetical protein